MFLIFHLPPYLVMFLEGVYWLLFIAIFPVVSPFECSRLMSVHIENGLDRFSYGRKPGYFGKLFSCDRSRVSAHSCSCDSEAEIGFLIAVKCAEMVIFNTSSVPFKTVRSLES